MCITDFSRGWKIYTHCLITDKEPTMNQTYEFTKYQVGKPTDSTGTISRVLDERTLKEQGWLTKTLSIEIQASICEITASSLLAHIKSSYSCLSTAHWVNVFHKLSFTLSAKARHFPIDKLFTSGVSGASPTLRRECLYLKNTITCKIKCQNRHRRWTWPSTLHRECTVLK